MVVVAVAEGVVEKTGVQPTGRPSHDAASEHISFEAPRTGQIMLSDVAAPAHVPGLLGSHAVHSQKPKVPTFAVGVNTTRLGFPVTSDPKLSAALKQQAFEFHEW